MKSIDDGKIAGALLIDLSKAFDTVPHQKLLVELKEMGCGSGSLEWFRSYLMNRSQRVVVKPIITKWKSVSRGFPQGGGLSPLLFNIYGRNIPACSDSTTHQFADDITISEAESSAEVVATKLMSSFKKIKECCVEKKLIINTEKTQFIIIKSPKRKIEDDFHIILDGIVIKPAAEVKLLGVMIDRHLTYACHLNYIKRKCHGLLGMLARASPEMSMNLMKLAYLAIVRSHMEYASAVFASAANTHLKKLDIVQKIASRIITGSPRDTHSQPLQDFLGLASLSSRRDDHIKKLVDDMINNESHPAFNGLFTMTEDGEAESAGGSSRTRIGERRFINYAKEKYNSM
jgi:hypothetical protein